MDLLRQLIARLEAADNTPAPLVQLSEVESGLPAVEHAPPTPLAPAAIQRLLAALPPLDQPAPASPAPVADATPARESQPEPLRVDSSPTPPDPPTIVLASPVGPVDVAERLSITFSQAMASLRPHATLERADVPMVIDPEPAGSWRWQDPRTLVFTPAERFPMATAYAVTVPPMRALSGGVTEPMAWTFSTPPPKIEEPAFPTWRTAEDVRNNQVIALFFNQAVDPGAIWPFLQLTANDQPLDFVRASQEDLRASQEDLSTVIRIWIDPTMTVQVYRDSHWVAIRPVQPLPPNSTIVFTVLAGAPSAEGPLRTSQDQSCSFTTYPPLSLTLSDSRRYPGTEWWISANNALGDDAFDPAMITIAPAVSYTATVSYRAITIQAEAEAGVPYIVTVASSLRDVFDQMLAEPAVFTITVDHPPPPPVLPPRLFVPKRAFVTLAAHTPWHYTVYTRGHALLQLRIWAVGPEHWGRFNAAHENLGTAISTTFVAAESPAELISGTVLDLHALCDGARGQYILEVEPANVTPAEPWEVQRLRVWVQITALDLTAVVCDPQVLVWASDWATGAARSGVALALRTASGLEASGWTEAQAAVDDHTDRDGEAALPTPALSNLLIARTDADMAILPIANRSQLFATAIDNRRGQLRWYVISDRGLYRPGETVQFKGWIRVASSVRHGTLDLSSAQSGSYVLRSERGAEIGRGTFAVGPRGGFDLAIPLPAALAPEPHRVTFTVGHYPPSRYTFAVQEFRRPEFVVRTSAEAQTFIAGEQAQVLVAADYYTGGPVADAEVTWTVAVKPYTFTEPKRIGPRWKWGYSGSSSPSTTVRGRTDPAGRHTLALDFAPLLPHGQTHLVIEATVTDRNQQALSSSTTVVVHPARVYVGLRIHDDDLAAEDDTTIQGAFLVVDLDGRPVIGQEVVIQISAIEGNGTRRPNRPQTEFAMNSAADPTTWSWTPPTPGFYLVKAYVIDDHGCLNWSSDRIRVPRIVHDQTHPARAEDALPTVKLSADKDSYRPGETALITIASPFVPARGILSLHGSGAPQTVMLAISRAVQQFSLTLPPVIAPNAQVQVMLIDLNRHDAMITPPLSATAVLPLTIDDPSQRLIVDVQPRTPHGRPDALMELDLTVRDSAGQPLAGGEIAVFVVDEAVLDLSAYQLPDPIPAWYPYPTLYASAHVGNQHRHRPNPAEWDVDKPNTRDELLGSSMGWGTSAAPLITPPGMRLDVSPLAFFEPGVRTDAAGRASVAFTLPDTLTRYRIMAVAVHGTEQIGHAQSSITVGLPLMLSLAPPRFLRPGDRSQLAVLVHNRTAAPLEVVLALRVDQLELPGAHGYRLDVPALNRAECVFALLAPLPGTATIQALASAGELADAASLVVPILPPSVHETSATYGELASAPVRESIHIPSAALPGVGGLAITLSASGLQQITDGLAYLIAYPYGCAEQRASRLLALASVAPRWADFSAAELPSAERLGTIVAADRAHLIAAQRPDGGWGLWPGAAESWPYVSAHVAHALSRQADPDPALADTLGRTVAYLEQLEHTLSADQSTVRLTVLAYAWYVLQLLGNAQESRINALLESIEVRDLPPEPAAWLLATLAQAAQPSPWRDTLRQHLINQLHQSAGEAHIRSGYRDHGQILLFSERRVDAVTLFALLADQPDSAAVPPLARGLLAGRVTGRWATTQENAFAVLALERYSARFDQDPPECVAQISLAGQLLAEHQFSGQPGQTTQVQVPMAELLRHPGEQQITMIRQGSGRLHYRIAVHAAVGASDLPELRQGFTLARHYAGGELARDVTQQSDGGWCFAVGGLVEVTLTLTVTEARHHVALVDPIPAGCEILNAALATSSSLASQGIDRWRWPVRHIYADRLEMFAEQLPPGSYTLSYMLRTTSAGTFSVPAPWVEEMYHPEVAGRGLAALVVIT